MDRTIDLSGARRRLPRRAALLVVVASAGMSGCALTANQTEITGLSDAASQFKSAVSGGAPAAAARADANKARLVGFIARGQIPPVSACAPPTALERAFDADVAQGNATAAASWQALLKSPSCNWGLDLEPAAPGSSTPQPIVGALDDYYSGVAAIASATSVQQVVDATNKATGAVTTLASLVPGVAAPARAASALIGKLVQYGLRAAQYRALEIVLGDVDSTLDQASGPIIASLRVQQGYWISQTALFAGDGVSALRDAFAAAPADRLALLQVSQPILDDFATQQRRVRADPGAAYQALVTAHHKLYAALKSNKGQLAGVLAAARDIAGSAQTLAGAVTPAAPAKAATPAKPAAPAN